MKNNKYKLNLKNPLTYIFFLFYVILLIPFSMFTSDTIQNGIMEFVKYFKGEDIYEPIKLVVWFKIVI